MKNWGSTPLKTNLVGVYHRNIHTTFEPIAKSWWGAREVRKIEKFMTPFLPPTDRESLCYTNSLGVDKICSISKFTGPEKCGSQQMCCYLMQRQRFSKMMIEQIIDKIRYPPCWLIRNALRVKFLDIAPKLCNNSA